MRSILLLFALAACTDKDGDDSAPRTCVVVKAELDAEFVAVQSCTAPTECGQVILGTSCGCTRDKVARLDADLSGVEALIAEGYGMDCDLGLTSTCDCPDTGGYDCVEGTCSWLYTR